MMIEANASVLLESSLLGLANSMLSSSSYLSIYIYSSSKLGYWAEEF